MVVVVVVDRFYIAPLSRKLTALACESTCVTSFLKRICEYPPKMVVVVV